MNLFVKQFSSLEKICHAGDIQRTTLNRLSLLTGEHTSYQVAVYAEDATIDDHIPLTVTVESEIAEHVKIYVVKDVMADYPHAPNDNGVYITDTPTLIPDLLVPLKEQNGYANFVNRLCVFWVEVCVPHGTAPQKTDITLHITGHKIDPVASAMSPEFEVQSSMSVEILPCALPPQRTVFTQWFHVDCIATAHHVPVYSEAHWQLIDRYMSLATQLGINMILTPVLTPSLDVAPGHHRPCIQLVDVKKNANGYEFDFSKLRRYISLAKKNGIKYYEISHFFSQWGCRFSPVIWGEENGEYKQLFGWHVPANDARYAEFLKALIPALIQQLKEKGVWERSVFHISDEPSEQHVESYEYARNLITPLLEGSKTIDALSHIEFYQKGLVDSPVCATDMLEPFLENHVPGLWAYYCCAQGNGVSNRFMAMPSCQNRIIGLQLYKYGIEGFLQWGFNFYYSQYSLYPINPYVTTSADGIFPSGDPFSVYPGADGPLPSLRAFVFREALEDIEICRLLEEKIGREAVVSLIEEQAGMELTFKQYPNNAEYILNLIDTMKQMLTTD